MNISNQSGIYEILNIVNGKRYIGSAKSLSRRWKEHRRLLERGKHHSQILQRAWDKYGGDAFKFLPILTCAKSMLLFYEQQLLDKVEPEYNVATNASAPMTGKKHTLEALAKISKASTGNTYSLGTKRSAETCAELSRVKRGVKKSEDHKRKIGDGHRGKTVPEHVRLAMMGNKFALGHVHSVESRALMSKNKTGQTHSAETKALISRKKTGVRMSDENRAALSIALRNSDRVKEANKRTGAARVGTKLSDVTKAKQSEARRLWWAKKKAVTSTGGLC